MLLKEFLEVVSIKDFNLIFGVQLAKLPRAGYDLCAIYVTMYNSRSAHSQCTEDSSGVVGVSDPYHLVF